MLTGLKQKWEFPGVTVDKTGSLHPGNHLRADITDLPGTYSLYPKRADEWVVYKVLLNQDDEIRPDMILLVADASNPQAKPAFLLTIIDLKIPVVVALSMMDLCKTPRHTNWYSRAGAAGVPVIPVNPRKNKGIAP